MNTGTAPATPMVSPTSRSRSWRARCASPTPTTPCRSGVLTARPCPTMRRSPSSTAAARPSSTRRSSSPSSASWHDSTSSRPRRVQRRRAGRRADRPGRTRHVARAARREPARVPAHRGRAAGRSRRSSSGAIPHHGGRRRRRQVRHHRRCRRSRPGAFAAGQRGLRRRRAARDLRRRARPTSMCSTSTSGASGCAASPSCATSRERSSRSSRPTFRRPGSAAPRWRACAAMWPRPSPPCSRLPRRG